MKRAVSAITILLVMAMLSGCALNLKSKDQFYEDNVKEKILQELTNDYGTIYDMNELKELRLELYPGRRCVLYFSGTNDGKGYELYAKATTASINSFYSGSIQTSFTVDRYLYNDILEKEIVDKSLTTYTTIDNNGYVNYQSIKPDKGLLFTVITINADSSDNLAGYEVHFRL